MKNKTEGGRIRGQGDGSQLRDIAYATSTEIPSAAGAVAPLKINLALWSSQTTVSTSGSSATQSAPELLLATNPRWAEGRDQGKGPRSVEARPSCGRRRAGWGRWEDSAGAGREAIVFKLP